MRLLSLMKANGCKPDEWSYAEVISGFCKTGDLDGAMTFFHEMVDQGLKPNKVHLTTLIDGHCKKGEVETAVLLLETFN
ncbi:putative tetratricopeptide-like helical domain superfamily [Helianthus annuus]|nr:putative tetratricopeptide-like helical domain superfamily [Helianthus annuus]